MAYQNTDSFIVNIASIEDEWTLTSTEYYIVTEEVEFASAWMRREMRKEFKRELERACTREQRNRIKRGLNRFNSIVKLVQNAERRERRA